MLYPYAMLPTNEPSTKCVTIPTNQRMSDTSVKSGGMTPPLRASRSIPRTDCDIFSENGTGIPASNFKLLAAWVRHCEHSAAKHGKQSSNFKFFHFVLAILSLGTVASMTIVSAIVPKSNLETVIQSSFAAFLMGLQNVLDLQGRAKNYLVAPGEFTLMGRVIATTLGTIEEERNWNELCRMYQRQMDVIESHAPPV